jgi:hypothetical protein
MRSTAGGPVVTAAGVVVGVVTEAGGYAGRWGVCHGAAAVVQLALSAWVVEAINAAGQQEQRAG